MECPPIDLQWPLLTSGWPLDGPVSASESALVVFLVLGGLASAALAAIGASAYADRRSRSYLAVVLALFALSSKAVVGGLSIAGVFPYEYHHVIEHGLDFVAAMMLVAAIYGARAGSTPDETRPRSRPRSRPQEVRDEP